ncbi:MAG TPA: S4 domain-containing protein [Bacteroidales bacterium]
MEKSEVRIDKWMWATRIFKSRTIAVEACKRGRIMIQNMPAKASRNVKLGDVVQVRKPPITYSFQVVGLIDRRVGAKLVPDYLKDVTTKDQLQVLENARLTGFVDRARGTGRPTKRDRRDMESFSGDDSDGDFDFDFDFEGAE